MIATLLIVAIVLAAVSPPLALLCLIGAAVAIFFDLTNF